MASSDGGTSSPSPNAQSWPDEAAVVLRRFAAEGISHVMLWLDPCNTVGVAAFAATLSPLDRD